MTVKELSPEQFLYERYSADLLWLLDDALYSAVEFGYCDASRLAVRPRSGEYALMITWENGEQNWCHVTDRLLTAIRERLARRAEDGRGKKDVR